MSTSPLGVLPQPAGACSVLAVNLSKDDAASLAHFLEGSNWIFKQSPTCREAIARARIESLSVLVCATEMPGGDWKSLLDALAVLPDSPAVIVASGFAEERLWAEVLNMGGYDVLSLPFERSELLRALFLAQSASDRRAKASSSALDAPSSLTNLATALAAYSDVAAVSLK